MKKSKFNQVVLPVIIAGIVSMIIIRIVSYIVFPNPHEVEDSVNQEEYNSEQLKNNDEVFIQPDVMTVEEEDTSLTIGNVCIEDFLKENPDEIGRANTISEIILDGAFSSNCSDIIEGIIKPMVGEIIPLDLTSLSMFPNLKTLSIIGQDLTYNLYEEDYKPIYFFLDLETLKQFKNLTHLNLECVKIDNFAPLGGTSLHSLAIKSCDFNNLEEKGYE